MQNRKLWLSSSCVLGLTCILTWHRNETRTLAIADLIWYSAGEYAGPLTWFLWALRSFPSFELLHYISI